VQQKDIVDFIHGLSHSLMQGLSAAQGHELGNDIAEGIEKSRKKLFTIGASVALAGTGFFLTLWGIASTIDAVFVMRGFGFVLIGLIAVLIGALAYKR
jgi:hypothetical protein